MTRPGWPLAAAVILLAWPAAAAELGGVATANVTGGATNNALLAPDGSPALGRDEFTAVRASLDALARGSLIDQSLSYAYTATFFETHPEANTQTHQLSWLLNGTPTGRTTVHAQATATYAHLNSFNPLAAIGALNVQNVTGAAFVTVPSQPITYVSGTALASGTYRPSGTNLWSELTSVNMLVPTAGEAGHSLALAQGGHYERERAANALTVDLTLSYFDASTLVPTGGMALAPGATLNLQGTLGWRRDVSAGFFYGVNGGFLAIDTIGGNQLSVQPVGSATVHYQKENVLAELTVSQSSQLNVFVGQTLLVGGVTGRGVVPLDRLQRIRLVGLATADRQWAVASGSIDTAMDLLAADVGVAYQPVQQPFLASLEYSVQDQIGHASGAFTYPSLHRQVVMLTLTGTLGTGGAVH